MAVEGNETMAGPAEEFRASKAALIERAKTLLDEIVASSSRLERAGYASELRVTFDQLDATIEQVLQVKSDAISAAIDRRAHAENQRQPAVCSTCLKLLTECQSDLLEYIELVAQQAASGACWPADVCRAKLRAAMKPGDRVSMLGYGRLTIVRPDGTGFVVYQRES